jgi:hypothetical protein
MSVETEARDKAGKWTAGAAAITAALKGKIGDEAREAIDGGHAPSTRDLYTDDAGRYSQARKAVHEGIIKHFLAGTAPQEHPEAIFTAGGAASGKSSLAGRSDHAEANLPVPEGSVYVNPDDIKAMLPEHGALHEAGRADIAASATHDESSDIAKALTAVAIKQHRHVIVDGTGDSTIGKFGNKLRAAADAGYKVTARYAHIPVSEALVREQARAERTGRKVDDDILRAQHKNVARSYGSDVRNIPNETHPETGAKRDISVEVYSTAARGQPVLIANQPAGRPNNIINAKLFKEHTAKAVSS